MIESPVHSLFNLILLGGVVTFAVLYGEQKEKEKFEGDYDYDRENPNALISGYNVSGTVYSSYPNSTPGLGWVL